MEQWFEITWNVDKLAWVDLIAHNHVHNNVIEINGESVMHQLNISVQ